MRPRLHIGMHSLGGNHLNNMVASGGNTFLSLVGLRGGYADYV